MQKMNWDYIAGFFDGEGSLSFSVGKSNKEHRCFRLYFALTQNSTDVLEQIRDFLGMGKIYPRMREGRSRANPNHKPTWNYYVAGFRILPILKKLKNRCIVKRPQITLAIQFIEHRQSGSLTRTYTEEDVRFIAEMRNLNARSPGKGQPITSLSDILTTNRPSGRPKKVTQGS